MADVLNDTRFEMCLCLWKSRTRSQNSSRVKTSPGLIFSSLLHEIGLEDLEVLKVYQFSVTVREVKEKGCVLSMKQFHAADMCHVGSS